MIDMDNFNKQAVIIALKKMFNGSYFSICEVRDGLKLLGITPLPGQYESLAILHCVNWQDMPPNFREQVINRVSALFNHGTIFDLSIIEDTVQGNGKVISVNPAKREKVGLMAYLR